MSEAKQKYRTAKKNISYYARKLWELNLAVVDTIDVVEISLPVQDIFIKQAWLLLFTTGLLVISANISSKNGGRK